MLSNAVKYRSRPAGLTKSKDRPVGKRVNPFGFDEIHATHAIFGRQGARARGYTSAGTQASLVSILRTVVNLSTFRVAVGVQQDDLEQVTLSSAVRIRSDALL